VQLLMPCMSASRPSPMVPWPPGSLGPSGLDLDGNDERGISPTLPHVSSDLTSGCACACRCVWPAAVTHKVLVPYLYPYLQYKTSQGGNCLDGVPRHPINRPRADCFDWFRRIPSRSAILFHQQININRELPLRRSRLQPSTTASPSPSSLLRCCSST